MNLLTFVVYCKKVERQSDIQLRVEIACDACYVIGNNKKITFLNVNED